MERKEQEAKQTPQLDVQRTIHAQSSTDSEGRAQRVAKSTEEDAQDAREDAEDAKDKDSDEGEDHENGERPREEASSLDQRKRDMPAERREPIKVTQDQPSSLTATISMLMATQDHLKALPPDHLMATQEEVLDHLKASPFQIMSNKVLKWFSFGVFWVCFPSNARARSKKKYAPVFIEVARSQKWPVYPFCHLDVTHTLDGTSKGTELFYEDHFCDDVDKITFVMQMEKRGDGVSNSKHASSPHGETPILSQFGECSDAMIESPAWFIMDSPAWFKRTFPPDQDIQASLVEEFLNDVYSSKVQEVTPPKRDL